MKRFYPVIDMVETGKHITKLRKEKGLTVADLQEYFGFEAPQAIYKWQAGKSIPTIDNLLALSRLLGTSMEDLLVIRYQEIVTRDDSRVFRFWMLPGTQINRGCISPGLWQLVSFCSFRPFPPACTVLLPFRSKG